MITSCNSDSFGYKLFDHSVKNSKVSLLIELLQDSESISFLKSLLIELLQDSEIRSILKYLVGEFLATSELCILKRISAIESKLGLSELENEPITIPQKLADIEDKVNTLTESKKFNFETAIQPNSFSHSMTDIRTDLLIRHLQENKEVPKLQSNSANIEFPFCNSREFRNFIQNVLPEKYKPRSLKNIRKLKKDLFENAASRYKDLVHINQSFYGNREKRLVLAKEIELPGVTG